MSPVFTRAQKFIVAFVVLVIALLYVPYAPFYTLDVDRVQLLYRVSQFWVDGIFPSYGMLNSQMLYNPPHHIWLYVPLGSLSLHPNVIIFPSIVIHVGAIIAIFWIVTRYLSFEVAFATVLLYQTLPLGQYIGGATWAQALIPGLMLWMLYCALHWFDDGKTIYSIPCLLIITTMMGIHLASILLLPIIAVLMVYHRSKLNVLHLGIACVFIIITWLPFLSFQLERNFVDVLGVVDYDLRPRLQEDDNQFCPIVFRPPRESVDTDWFTNLKRFAVGQYRQIRDVTLGILSAVTTNFNIPRANVWDIQLWLVQIFKWLAWMSLFFAIHRALTDSKLHGYLLLFMLLLVMVQNLTRFNVLRRPDIAWIYYGIQVIFITSFLFYPKWQYRRFIRIFAWGLITTSVIVGVLNPRASTFDFINNVEMLAQGQPNEQASVIEWIIAQDDGVDDRIIIAYDFLPDVDNWCWIYRYSQVDDLYYVGVEFDYWLSLYNVENASDAADGQADNPDFILIFTSGLNRYDVAPDFQTENYAVFDMR
ncbi:MAG: hypothetical protein AAF846_01305 [Chloroflexota bacterium]